MFKDFDYATTRFCEACEIEARKAEHQTANSFERHTCGKEVVCKACEASKRHIILSSYEHTCGKDMPKEKTDWEDDYAEFLNNNPTPVEQRDYIRKLLAEQKIELYKSKEFKEAIELIKIEAKAEQKQEILDKLPKEISEIVHYKHLGTEVQAYDDGFNECLENIISIIKSI